MEPLSETAMSELTGPDPRCRVDPEEPKPMEWTFAQADATRLPLADQSVDLVFCSPPYTDARTYGINAQRKCAAWVEWMLHVVSEMTRVSRGLVLVNCAGVTRSRVYQPGPEGLMWEWWKRGGNLWRPAYWHRVGIPGSGGAQWLRADIEYVLCFKRDREWLPWADNTANGHKPKWAPGGEMSYRLSNGDRRNQWGRHVNCRTSFGVQQSAVGRRPNGERKAAYFNGNGFAKQHTKSLADGVKANPGNLVELSVDLAGLIDILDRYVKSTQSDPGEVLRNLQCALNAKGIRQWLYGTYATVLGQEILQSSMYGGGEAGRLFDEDLRNLREGVGEEDAAERPVGGDRGFSGKAILRDGMQGEGEPDARWSAMGRPSASGPEDRETEEASYSVREVRRDTATGSASQGQGRDQQQPREPGSGVPELPPKRAQDDDLQSLWWSPSVTRILQQALPEIQKVWRSVGEAVESSLGANESPNLVKIKVGGGMLGHPFAHVNEAPFPIDLAKYFIRSWCPPGGTVLDCFSGSGTTVDAAWRLGRKGIGLDLRASQCELGRRRMLNPHAKKSKPKRAKPGELMLFKEPA